MRPEPSIPLRSRLALARERARRLAARLRRPALLLGRGALAAAALGLAIVVGRFVQDHVRTSPYFAIRELALEGAETVDPAAILEWAGVHEGENIFAQSASQIEERLREHPWIAQASVRRQLPGRLDLRIREHVPVAVLALERLYLVSEEGALFKEVEADDSTDLPIITGVHSGRFLADRPYRTSLLLEVVALMHDYRGAGLWRREPISELHVADDDTLTIFVGEDAMRAELGRPPYRPKLGKLRRILDRLADREARPLYVLLDNERRPDRVTVKLR